MIYRNKNLSLEFLRTSECEKPIITPVGTIKDRYVTDYYNACTAVHKTQSDFISVVTSDNRMKQVLEQTHRMLPTEVRVVSKVAYVQTYKVSKDVWAEIVAAHTKAPAAPESAGGLYRGFQRAAKDKAHQRG